MNRQKMHSQRKFQTKKVSKPKLTVLLPSLQESLLQLETNGTLNTSPDVIYPTSCLTSGDLENGLHTLKVPGLSPFQVYCENQLAGPGWIVIQKRFSGNLSFFRNWKEYKNGFGNLMDEYFLGLEKIRALTALEPHELYVHLEDFDDTIKHAKFDEFAIGNEDDDYAMNTLENIRALREIPSAHTAK